MMMGGLIGLLLISGFCNGQVTRYKQQHGGGGGGLL